MTNETELLKEAQNLFKKLGGIGNRDACIVSGWMHIIGQKSIKKPSGDLKITRKPALTNGYSAIDQRGEVLFVCSVESTAEAFVTGYDQGRATHE